MISRCALVALWCCATVYGQTIHVSPNGPIASLEQARDAARAERHAGHKGPIRIVVHAGRYTLGRTLQLGPEDSNTQWEAAPGEQPIISGGQTVLNWKCAERGICSAPAVGLDAHQLFVNGVRAIRARTPNRGFLHIDGDSSTAKPFQLHYRNNDIQADWAARGDVEVVALLAWADLRRPIVHVDSANKLATLAGDPEKSNHERDARYYIENTPDALDSAGEWYLDRKAQRIYYMPRPNEDVQRAEVIATTLETLVSIGDQEKGSKPTKKISFKGLTFAYGDWKMPPSGYADVQSASYAPSLVQVRSASHIAMDHCRVAHAGGYAIWFAQGAHDSSVTASEIVDMGAGGIKIGEPMLQATSGTSSGSILVEGNQIHDLGNVYAPGVGVWVLESARNKILHNEIHHLYYSAISLGWTWGYGPNRARDNIVAFNHLHDVGQGMLADMGAIYTLGKQPGTIVRNNLIHDVSASAYGAWGIYTDEGSSDILIEKNIVYHCSSSAFVQHYGKGNRVRNNIFAFDGEHEIMRTKNEDHLSFHLDHNIVYTRQSALLGGNWEGDQFDLHHNLYFISSSEKADFVGHSFAQWQTLGHDRGSRIADPLFVDPDHFNFALRGSSPALRLGFHPIDVSRIGPQHSVGPDVR